MASESNECRLMLNHILLTERGRQGAGERKTGLLYTLSQYLEEQKLKYQLLNDQSALLFTGVAPRARVHGELEHNAHNVALIKELYRSTSPSSTLVASSGHAGGL